MHKLTIKGADLHTELKLLFVGFFADLNICRRVAVKLTEIYEKGEYLYTEVVIEKYEGDIC